MSDYKKIAILAAVCVIVALFFVAFITKNQSPLSENREVPHEDTWGIYVLDLETEKTELVYSSANTISRIRLNNAGDRLVFSQQIDRDSIECAAEGSPINLCKEICSVSVDGEDYRRLTDNEFCDLVPCWSSGDTQIFFLSFRDTMEIFVMDADGGNMREFYDSGVHDSDLHCSGGKLAFTRDSQIWIMDEDGANLAQVTEPPRAGEWGNAVLPFGDYDPNLSPDGNRIVFERMVDDETTHGNYNIYVINVDGSVEAALTDTGYTQGLPDIYLMNADGSENRNTTPNYFHADFLCHDPIFSEDDSKIFFVGEWYN
jgi:hypothetical protein